MDTYYLENEIESLMVRINQLKSFDTTMSMVKAARVSEEAELLINKTIESDKKDLIRYANQVLSIIHQDNTNLEKAQKLLTSLKLKFNEVIEVYDLYADVISQRGEHETGVLCAGLDKLAKSGIQINSPHFKSPPMICFLNRGLGGVIRRVKTILPDGSLAPVAVIQLPRERIPGNGLASSLIHEVGHQGIALLGLKDPITKELQLVIAQKQNKIPWMLFREWINEILADIWACAKLGVGATLGLINVMSLPAYYIFRYIPNDCHPIPYIRVKISCQVGRALYPDDQWKYLEKQWERQYPKKNMGEKLKQNLAGIEKEISELVSLIINFKAGGIQNYSFKKLFAIENRAPNVLRNKFPLLKSQEQLENYDPIYLMALIGQAKMDRILGPKAENEMIKKLLNDWALTNN